MLDIWIGKYHVIADDNNLTLYWKHTITTKDKETEEEFEKEVETRLGYYTQLISLFQRIQKHAVMNSEAANVEEVIQVIEKSERRILKALKQIEEGE